MTSAHPAPPLLHHATRAPDAGPARSSRPRLALAALASALLAALGLWFALDPDVNPLADPEQALLRLALGTTGTTLVLLALALAGLGVAALALGAGPAGPTGRARDLVRAVALVEVLGLGVALQSVSPIALAGYLVAVALPVGLVWLVVQVVRRYPRLRWVVLLAVAVLLVAGVTSDTLTGPHLARLASDLAAGFAREAVPLVLVVVVGASTAAWALVALGLQRAGGPEARMGDWVQRHRRGLTLLAAAGPVPYGLLRASWLTPWPLLVPPGEALDPATRIWGLLLGGGAALGCVLTVGLIRPWGTVFPRWVPGLAGRRVPPAAAVVPGGFVAGVVTASAIPMLRLTLAAVPGTVFSALPLVDRLLAVLLFPFWVWGPALALAVWGYARSRR